jgi:hypothetical protein
MKRSDLLSKIGSAFVAETDNCSLSEKNLAKLRDAHTELCEIVLQATVDTSDEFKSLNSVHRKLLKAINRHTFEALELATSTFNSLFENGYEPFLPENFGSTAANPNNNPSWLEILHENLIISHAFWRFKPAHRPIIDKYIGCTHMVHITDLYIQRFSKSELRDRKTQLFVSDLNQFWLERESILKELPDNVKITWQKLCSDNNKELFGLLHSIHPIDLNSKGSDLSLTLNIYRYSAYFLCNFPIILKKSSRSKFMRARDKLEACEVSGRMLNYLAVWSQIVVEQSTQKFCATCYRCISHHGSKYCTVHKRRAEKRPSNRDQYVGEISQLLAKKYEADHYIGPNETITLMQRSYDCYKLKEHFQDYKLPTRRTILTAIEIGTLLQDLQAAIGMDLYFKAWQHLDNMLTFLEMEAQYLKKNPRPRDEVIAKFNTWFTRDMFFRTWFGKGDGELFSGAKFSAESIDPDHYLAHSASPSLSEIRTSLIRRRAWQEVDAEFDQLAYIDPKIISQLRASSPGGKGLSFSSIGQQIGVSGEAVRKVFKTMSAGDEVISRPRRLRLSLSDLDEIKEYFGLN